MPNVVYPMGVSLDGYVAGPDGRFDWTPPDPTLFRWLIEEARGFGTYLMGRRLYETMLYWETVDEAALDQDARTWAELWKPLPKVVVSTTLTEVTGHARLAAGDLTAEIEGLRSERLDGDIAIGGATLAASAARLDLIDEYRPRVYPVLVGGGTPFVAPDDRRVDLELLDSRRVGPAVCQRYRVRRAI